MVAKLEANLKPKATRKLNMGVQPLPPGVCSTHTPSHPLFLFPVSCSFWLPLARSRALPWRKPARQAWAQLACGASRTRHHAALHACMGEQDCPGRKNCELELDDYWKKSLLYKRADARAGRAIQLNALWFSTRRLFSHPYSQ